MENGRRSVCKRKTQPPFIRSKPRLKAPASKCIVAAALSVLQFVRRCVTSASAVYICKKWVISITSFYPFEGSCDFQRLVFICGAAGRGNTLTRAMTLDDCCLFYAEEIRIAAGLDSPALVVAFGRVPREKFMGQPPGQVASPDIAMMAIMILAGAGYRESQRPFSQCPCCSCSGSSFKQRAAKCGVQLDRCSRARGRRPRLPPGLRRWRLRCKHGRSGWNGRAGGCQLGGSGPGGSSSAVSRSLPECFRPRGRWRGVRSRRL